MKEKPRPEYTQAVPPEMTVAWYSGHTLYDRPRRVLWSGQWLEVIAVLERGYTPEGGFIKILASNQEVFLLDYSLNEDSWRLAPSE